MRSAFFERRADGVLIPQQSAASGWGADHMRGMAISGALVREVEHTVGALGRPELAPVRWTLDLFRVARLVPTTVTASIVREGGRLCLVDAEMTQDGRAVARARTLYLKKQSDDDQREPAAWASESRFLAPPPDFPRTPDVERLYRADGEPWSVPQDAPLSSERKHVWQYPIALVEGEEPTGFQLAASVADVASATVNLGSRGLEFVNADVTLALARQPEGLELGMTAITRTEDGGISVGSAEVFDRRGLIGTAVVCAVDNAANAVDLRKHGHSGEA